MSSTRSVNNPSLESINEDIFGMYPNAFHLGGVNPSAEDLDEKIEQEKHTGSSTSQNSKEQQKGKEIVTIIYLPFIL